MNTTIVLVNLAEIIVWAAFGLVGLFSLLFIFLFASLPSLPSFPLPFFLRFFFYSNTGSFTGIHPATLWSGVLKTLTESHGKQFADELSSLSSEKPLDSSFKKVADDTSGVYEIIRLVSSEAKEDGVILGLRRV